MDTNIEPQRLRWRDTHELFNCQDSLLVFLLDGLHDDWHVVPPDVRAILETMQSATANPVRVFEVDARVDADFLSLFGTRPGHGVVRKLPSNDRFDVLNAGFTWGELIEFCRPAFEDKPKSRFSAPGEHVKERGAAGEIVLS